MSFDSNPFEQAEAWEVSTDTMLPVGNHLVKIIEAEDGTANSSGNPQLTLRFENAEGAIRAWEAYHGDFLGRVVALYRSTGAQLPQPGEFDPNDRYRLSADCINRLLNRNVGIVVRDEDDNLKPGQKRRRVSGYVEPEKLGGKKGGGSTSTKATQTAGVASGPSAADDDLPF